jgi:GNAT superfamily N-acetyltransferase
VPVGRALLAWEEARLVGLASYSFLWPAVGLTRSLYLKELYVVESARRGGAGALLMRGVADIALKQGCSRLEWTTDRGNNQADEFYSHLGFPVNTSKTFYRVDMDDLTRSPSSGTSSAP